MLRSPTTYLACLVLVLAVGASAQEEATAFDVSLANPGARSLGFGGAFLALADDATAAFANPAGLSQLLEPELTFEIRGQLVPDDAGAVTDEDGSVLAFLAFVYPRKKWAAAIYQNGFANSTTGTRIQGLGGGRAWDIGLLNQYQLESIGLSLSYRLTESLSLGAGVAQWQGDLISIRDSTLLGADFFGPVERRLTTVVTTEDTDLTFSAGFLWHLTEQWRLGGAYRGGPEFTLRTEARAGPPPVESLPPTIHQFPFLLPDVLGLGAAFKTRGGGLTLSFEWDLVRYSRLLDSLPDPDRRSFDLDDGHELHFGVEYVVVRSRPVIALRLGAWREPAHRLRYLGADPIDRATFGGGREETHYAAGFGLAFKSLKLDVAFDDADSLTTGSFTLSYSF